MKLFQLHVHRETSRLDQNGRRTYLSGFDFEVIGYSNWNFVEFRMAIFNQHAWVVMMRWNSNTMTRFRIDLSKLLSIQIYLLCLLEILRQGQLFCKMM
jgi:hypothetical protein